MRVRGASPRTTLLMLLFLLSVPGYLLIVKHIIGASPDEIVRRIEVWRQYVQEAAQSFETDPALVIAVIAVESKGDPEARSSVGAIGLMQLMPETARDVARHLRDPEPEESDLLDPATNIRLGTCYLSMQIAEFEDLSLALAAYNA